MVWRIALLCSAEELKKEEEMQQVVCCAKAFFSPPTGSLLSLFLILFLYKTSIFGSPRRGDCQLGGT
jgi:hypothetical protein